MRTLLYHSRACGGQLKILSPCLARSPFTHASKFSCRIAISLCFFGSVPLRFMVFLPLSPKNAYVKLSCSNYGSYPRITIREGLPQSHHLTTSEHRNASDRPAVYRHGCKTFDGFFFCNILFCILHIYLPCLLRNAF